MKTATVRQLRNQYRELLGWVAAGEEVTISQRGKVIARLVPQSTETSKRTDWVRSAAARMDKAKLPCLQFDFTVTLVAERQGRY